MGQHSLRNEPIPLALEHTELYAKKTYYGRIVECSLFITKYPAQRLGLTIELYNHKEDGAVSISFPTPIPCYSIFYKALTAFKEFNKICCEDLINKRVSFSIDYPDHDTNQRPIIMFKFLKDTDKCEFTSDIEKELDGGIDDIPNVLDDEE